MADPSGVISLTAGASALAWKIYKSCRDSPGQYQELSQETKQLADILREVDDLMDDESHVDLFRRDFIGSIQSCTTLLVDLRTCLDRFKSLGTAQRRMPDRLKWDEQQVKRLHARIASNIQMLSMSLQRYNASTQVKVVRLLNDILEQLRNGQRKAESVSSFAAAKEGNEEQAWPDIVHDLGDLGLAEDDANDNRELIIGILREAHFDGFGSEADTEPSSLPVIHTPPRPIPPTRSSFLSSPERTETMASSSPADRIFSEASISDRPDSLTSVDTTPMDSFGSLNIHTTHNRKFLSIFDPVAMDIEANVKRQPNTLRDDINLAKRYWSEKDWGNCKLRLLRLLVASELPHHRRPDLSPRLVTHLLGVACTNSGDLETARLAFTAVLADNFPPSSRPTSPSSTIPSPNPECMLEDSGIAAATWLGDICLMTDRGLDAAFAYAIALDSIRRKRMIQPHRPSSIASGQTDTLNVHPLNQSALKRASNSSNVSALKSTHEQLLACELDIANSQINHLDELLENLYDDNFPHACTSIFEDVNLPPGTLAIGQQAQAPIGGLSSSTYPLMKEFRAHVKNTSLDENPFRESCERSKYVARLVPHGLVSIEDRLTLRASKAGWPLMWNPRFSFWAPLHSTEKFHNITTAPEDTLLSNLKVLSQASSKELTADHTISKDEADDVVSGLRKWLRTSHIDHKQFPAELRCRPQPDHANQWPDIATFAIKAHIVKDSGLFKKPNKIGLRIADVMHWDGCFDPRDQIREPSSSLNALLGAFKAHCKSEGVVNRAASKKRDLSEYQRRYTQRVLPM